ncbi:hypothetical protein FZEAL_3582 [Fusarium zealandicum]|uniref:Rhodopsin domain-containing protein n=1 Tax=Fusarium zealandicum TaxID=1053134 RepID=A0A8H4XLP1_9HYPO|nr:hypothetical protein FZEAL_3582 [Fusarium zealandicum]
MDSFTIEAFVLLGIGLGIISMRTFVRVSSVGFGRLEADDYLMLVAAITYSIETALAYSVGAYWHGLANSGMTDEQRKALDPESAEYMLRVNGSKTQIAGWSTYTFLLWVLKAAMCSFYLRLTDGLDNYRPRIFVGFGLIFVTWVAVLLSILLGCQSFEKNWQIYPNPGNHCQPAISNIDVFVTVVLNATTDLYLLSIPVPMLWSARLPMPKKIGLITLFSGGIFVTAAGILRCVLIVTNPVTGAQQAGSWAVRETFVAVVTTNLPMIFPFLRRQLSPILGTYMSQFSKGFSSKYASSKRQTNPMHGSIRLDDVKTETTSGASRNKGGGFSRYPIMSEGAASDEYLPGDGIRKDTEVRVTEEARDGSRSRQGGESDLARALYGQPGVRGMTDIEYGGMVYGDNRV